MAEKKVAGKTVRVDAETLRLVKVSAAVCGESMAAWLETACRQRLEREGRHAAGSKRRVASVQFVSEESK